jgi:hypothetical protein
LQLRPVPSTNTLPPNPKREHITTVVDSPYRWPICQPPQGGYCWGKPMWCMGQTSPWRGPIDGVSIVAYEIHPHQGVVYKLSLPIQCQEHESKGALSLPTHLQALVCLFPWLSPSKPIRKRKFPTILYLVGASLSLAHG